MQFDAGVAALSSWDPLVIWISYNFRADIQRRAREDTEVESEDPRFYQLETKTSVRTETRDYPGYFKPHEEMEVAVYTLVCDCNIK